MRARQAPGNDQEIDSKKCGTWVVMAAEEDFGIAAVEAQAAGAPVLAYGRGGALETVVCNGEGATGVLFHRQRPETLEAAVRRRAGLRTARSYL